MENKVKINKIIEVSLENLLDRDIDEFNDLLEEAVLGYDGMMNHILSDIAYRVVGTNGERIQIEVIADKIEV